MASFVVARPLLAEAIQNVVKNHYVAYILDGHVAQNAPHNDDPVQKIIYATSPGLTQMMEKSLFPSGHWTQGAISTIIPNFSPPFLRKRSF
ncbi:MAG: hypothetical protein A3E85_03040 [Gammaproteobacteria bacterium RIFCSPHIGHO2_12_FULL_45_12]|nr:MAG: hypothetical protein A3E85_03040 [Gammaproteobacteria bacterium RIFCSPHIGHO2_12_FULL_45_12]